MYEVADVPDDKAVDYLVDNGVEASKAKEIVDLVGGRLVYLETSITLIKTLGWESDLCEKVKSVIFSRKLNAQGVTILTHLPESEAIIKEISEHGSVLVTELISNAPDKGKIKNVIREMVYNNILRYGIEGSLKWHGRIQQNELSNKEEQ